jgi:anti-sigma B factor antagonist
MRDECQPWSEHHGFVRPVVGGFRFGVALAPGTVGSPSVGGANSGRPDSADDERVPSPVAKQAERRARRRFRSLGPGTRCRVLDEPAVSNAAQRRSEAPSGGLPLRIEVRRDVASSVVSIAGEMDLINVLDVRKAFDELVDDGERHVIVDLEGLAFIDMRGIDVLEAVGRRLTSAEGRLELCGANRPVARLLELRDHIPGAGPAPWVLQPST